MRGRTPASERAARRHGRACRASAVGVVPGGPASERAARRPAGRTASAGRRRVGVVPGGRLPSVRRGGLPGGPRLPGRRRSASSRAVGFRACGAAACPEGRACRGVGGRRLPGREVQAGVVGYAADGRGGRGDEAGWRPAESRRPVSAFNGPRRRREPTAVSGANRPRPRRRAGRRPSGLPTGVDNRNEFGNDRGMTVAPLRRRPCLRPVAAGKRVILSQHPGAANLSLSLSLSLSLFNNRTR